MVSDLILSKETSLDDKNIAHKLNDDKKFKLASLLSKKHIKTLLLLLVMLIAIILYLGINDNKKVVESSKTNDDGYLSTLEYCERLEEKLERIISQIDGAGTVKVMVSVSGSPEIIYVSDMDNKTSTTTNGSTTTTTSSPIIIGSGSNSSGIIKTETLPDVKGVIVVSSGANQVGIKLDILKAVATLLDISTDKITILKGV